MEIQFFNHASFSIKGENSLLLSDPWFRGKAFNNGWELLIEDISFEFDYKLNNYIYYSHEHPDHFSIDFLKSISSSLRPKITILYQKTLDKKVIRFCKKQGFETVELNDMELFQLEPNFTIQIGKVPFYDSFLIAKVNDKIIINANDAAIEKEHIRNKIQENITSCNILFTQFSYANWIEGGPFYKTERQNIANEKLKRIKSQAAFLKPEFIVPFASMIKFCHIENSFMNDSINNIETAEKYIKNNISSLPIVLCPYEKWDGSLKKDNTISLISWHRKFEEAYKRNLVKTNKKVDTESLQKSCNDMLLRVSKRNNYFFIKILSIVGFLPRVYFNVIDQGCFYCFDWVKGLKKTRQNLSSHKIIKLSAESLKFLMDFDYGIDTLFVNARFQTSSKSQKKLIRTFSILSLNNTGRFISFRLIFDLIKDPRFLSKGLQVIGFLKK